MIPAKKIFRGYSESEVRQMEDGYFLLDFGGDFIAEDGHYLFTKKEVTKLYRDSIKKLIGMIQSENENDRKFSLELIPKIIVQPMRLH